MHLISRRELLHTIATFAAGAAATVATPGCGVFLNSRSSAIFASLPHPDEYMPVLRALCETFLPFDHPEFSNITRNDVERRLLEYFPLDDASEYASLRRALVYFGDVGLAPHAAVPITNAERNLVEAAKMEGIVEVDARVKRDRVTVRQLRLSSSSFVRLSAEERTRYLNTWATSALVTKRRFYRSTKSIVMIAAFSLEASWHAIGYEGPLLEHHT